MATYGGKVRFACSATPIEQLTDGEAGTHEIAASTPHGSIAGTGEMTLTAIDDTGGALFGYSNGVPYYVEANDSTTTAISTAADDFVIIKHTGYAYSTATELSINKTTDYLSIFVRDGSTDNWVGSLAPEESMYVPIRGRSSYLVKVKSTDAVGGAAAGSTHIAVEFFAGT